MDRPQSGMQVAQTSSGPGAVIRAIRRSQIHKNPKLIIPLALWVFGLYAMFLSPPPQRITPEKQATFDAKVAEAQHLTEVFHSPEKGEVYAR
jgi:hypothetical protein